jgi:hypothetical protein
MQPLQQQNARFLLRIIWSSDGRKDAAIQSASAIRDLHSDPNQEPNGPLFGEDLWDKHTFTYTHHHNTRGTTTVRTDQPTAKTTTELRTRTQNGR